MSDVQVQSNKEKAKALVATFVEFLKDNKLSNCCWFASGMLLAAKLYPAAMIITIIGCTNYALDRVVDDGIRQATEQCWNMFTPEQQMKLYAMVADIDELDETVVQ